jgi:phosphoribosylglycinamide formyltransferase
MPSPAKVTVLISGSGSNLQALINASTSSTPPTLPNVTFTRVISDRASAYGLQRATAAGIPTSTLGILPYKKRFPDPSGTPAFQSAREAYDADLAALVLQDKPDMVVCAGFMRILTGVFLEPLEKAGVRIINLHPALHGDLVGAGCIERAWAEFEEGKRRKTGVMVHYVIAAVDEGEPILQREVDMEGCKSLEELQERIHTVEHGLIVEGARRVAEEVASKSAN